MVHQGKIAFGAQGEVDFASGRGHGYFFGFIGLYFECHIEVARWIDAAALLLHGILHGFHLQGVPHPEHTHTLEDRLGHPVCTHAVFIGTDSHDQVDVDAWFQHSAQATFAIHLDGDRPGPVGNHRLQLCHGAGRVEALWAQDLAFQDALFYHRPHNFGFRRVEFAAGKCGLGEATQLDVVLLHHVARQKATAGYQDLGGLQRTAGLCQLRLTVP